MGAPPGALPWRVRCMAGDLFLRYGRRLLGGILTGFDRDYQAISRAYWCPIPGAFYAHSGHAHRGFETYTLLVKLRGSSVTRCSARSRRRHGSGSAAVASGWGAMSRS